MSMPYDANDDELLDYETEQDEELVKVQPIEPVPVHVCEPVVTVPTVAQHTTCRTYTLTSATPVQVAMLDALRTRLQFIVKGSNDVVLCHSISQAQDPANADATLAAPNGALLPGGSTIPVTSTGPLWLVANTFPTRVAVIIERRGT